MESLGIPVLLAVGALLALQAAANVQLSAALASPFGASTLQLGIGAAVLALLAAAAGTLGAVDLLGEVEPWHLIGGIGSAMYITAGILLFPRLGAVVAVGLFIAGQIGASLVLDGFGWLGVEREAIGPAGALGAMAVATGAAMIVRAQAGGAALESASNRAGWIVLGLLAGAVLPVQGAINAQLRADLDAPITVGAISFVVATFSMIVVLALVLTAAGAARPRPRGLATLPWWGWLGGLCGAAYVVSVFAFIPEIGVAPTIALTVAGQQLASVLVDRFGLLRLPRRDVGRRRLLGVAVLLTGVGLVQLV
ncbi:MAG TPA: DMT family transporter [Solirubrobacterales bacterium]|nr:DMT family transporter [Solirubrobacterales bacterium]